MTLNPYQPANRGAVERFSRTLKEQSVGEARWRDQLTLDELNANIKAWVAERSHPDAPLTPHDADSAPGCTSTSTSMPCKSNLVQQRAKKGPRS